MTSEQLHEALNELDDKLIEEAETVRNKPRRLPRRSAYGIAVAACFCVAAVALLAMKMHRLSQLLDKEPTGESAYTAASHTELGTETTVTEPYLDGDNGTDTTTVQAGAATDINTVMTTNMTPHTMGTSASLNLAERPTAIVRITAWDGNGFRGVVIRGEDTDAVTAGEAVTVAFMENIGFEVNDGKYVTFNCHAPTEEDFPIDSVVKVQFVRRSVGAEGESVLYADVVGFEAVSE